MTAADMKLTETQPREAIYYRILFQPFLHPYRMHQIIKRVSNIYYSIELSPVSYILTCLIVLHGGGRMVIGL